MNINSTCLHFPENNHEPNSTAYYCVDTFKSEKCYLRSFVGKDCVSNLILDLNNLATECIENMRENQNINISVRQQKIFEKKVCYHCKQNFSKQPTLRCGTIATEQVNTAAQHVTSAA